MNLMKYFTSIFVALYFAGSVIAQDAPIKEYSSDNRLMSNVVTAGVLENGMVIHIHGSGMTLPKHSIQDTAQKMGLCQRV